MHGFNVALFEVQWIQNNVRLCYKLLAICLLFLRFYMGVLDMLNLIAFPMADGVLSMTGAVYCSAPTFLYWKGCLVHGLFASFKFKVQPLSALMYNPHRIYLSAPHPCAR